MGESLPLLTVFAMGGVRMVNYAPLRDPLRDLSEQFVPHVLQAGRTDVAQLLRCLSRWPGEDPALSLVCLLAAFSFLPESD